jgi:phosphatidylglycerophosphate synthase
MAWLLAKTRVTPNQVTLASFGIAFLSFIGFVFGQNIAAGLLVQLSFIVDSSRMHKTKQDWIAL